MYVRKRRRHLRPYKLRVCCTHETRVFSLSVKGVYSPRHMSWHRSGICFSTQQGTWLRPSAMHFTMLGKSFSQTSGPTSVVPSNILWTLQKPMHWEETFECSQHSVKSWVNTGGAWLGRQKLRLSWELSGGGKRKTSLDSAVAVSVLFPSESSFTAFKKHDVKATKTLKIL